MVSNDDRCANTKLYVGNLSSRTSSNDLDRLFSNFGRVRDVDMKRSYAFVELGDRRDADAARYALDGTVFDGSRITVKFAKGVTRGPPGYGQCFKSSMFGHWAGDCKAADRMILALALALAFQFLFVSFFFIC